MCDRRRWTGRDRAALDHHVAALGVAPPSEMPLFNRVGAALATTKAIVEVVGGDTSGEVEPILLDDPVRGRVIEHGYEAVSPPVIS